MFNRKPPEKKFVEKVAAAYELLGLQEEQERVLEKYQSLFMASPKFRSKKKIGKRNLKNGGDKNAGTISVCLNILPLLILNLLLQVAFQRVCENYANKYMPMLGST
jgi:hypothetical protein